VSSSSIDLCLVDGLGAVCGISVGYLKPFPVLPSKIWPNSRTDQPFWRVQKDHSQPKQVSGPNAKAPKHQAIIMSVGPKRTRQTGTEHLNKQEVTQAWRTAKIDAERAGMFLLGSSTSSCGELGLMAAVSANLHEPPQHLNTTVGTSRAGVPKQLPKHPEKQIKVGATHNPQHLSFSTKCD